MNSKRLRGGDLSSLERLAWLARDADLHAAGGGVVAVLAVV